MEDKVNAAAINWKIIMKQMKLANNLSWGVLIWWDINMAGIRSLNKRPIWIPKTAIIDASRPVIVKCTKLELLIPIIHVAAITIMKIFRDIILIYDFFFMNFDKMLVQISIAIKPRIGASRNWHTINR